MRSHTPPIALSRHIGTMRMIASGRLQLSYCAASSEEDEQHAERENVRRAVAGELLLQRHLRPFVGEACRQSFFRELLDGASASPVLDARRGLAVEIGGGIHVVARDFVRRR